MGGGGREKGTPPEAKREKGKRRPTHFCPELTRHTHRAHARTTRNDFPVELSPPTSDMVRRPSPSPPPPPATMVSPPLPPPGGGPAGADQSWSGWAGQTGTWPGTQARGWTNGQAGARCACMGGLAGGRATEPATSTRRHSFKKKTFRKSMHQMFVCSWLADAARSSGPQG